MDNHYAGGVLPPSPHKSAGAHPVGHFSLLCSPVGGVLASASDQSSGRLWSRGQFGGAPDQANMATLRATLLCLLIALSSTMWMEGASALPRRSNCPVSGRKLCAEVSQSVKLTCCEPNPGSPYAYAKHGCVDLLSDPGFCGSCTNLCKNGETCVAGKCVPVKVCKFACIKGYTCCNGQCVNTQADNYNCGKCGVSCGPPKGQVGLLKFCYNGECVI